MTNREINVLDLLCDILAHWRTILVYMVIGAVLFGMLGYRTNYKAAYLAEQARREALLSEELGEDIAGTNAAADADEPLSEMEIANVETVIFWEDQAATKGDLLFDSFWSEFDYKEVYVGKLTFAISSSVESGFAHLESLYRKDDGVYFYNWLEENKPELTQSWTLEGFDVSGDYISNSNNYAEIEEVITSKDFLYITIVARDSKECEDLVKAYKQYMEYINKKYCETIGGHTVELIADAVVCGEREDILNKQKNWENERAAALAKGSSMKNVFSKNEKAYYSLRKSGLSSQEASVKFEEARLGESEKVSDGTTEFGPIAVKGSINKKYILLGIIAFAVLYCGFRFLFYILSNKLKECDDIKSMYDIERIGTIYKAQNTKKMFGFVDRLIYGLRHSEGRVFTQEESIGFASSAIALLADKFDCKQIYAVGCDLKGTSSDIIDVVSEKLKKNDVKIVTLSDVIYDSAALEKLKDAQYAFMVEKAGSTMYGEISKEKEILMRQGINILGALIIE